MRHMYSFKQGSKRCLGKLQIQPPTNLPMIKQSNEVFADILINDGHFKCLGVGSWDTVRSSRVRINLQRKVKFSGLSDGLIRIRSCLALHQSNTIINYANIFFFGWVKEFENDSARVLKIKYLYLLIEHVLFKCLLCDLGLKILWSADGRLHHCSGL